MENTYFFNELLVKIFLPYHANFINQNKDLDYMIRPKKEFISELNSDKRRKINFDLKYFKNHLEKDNNKYTLGTMLEILSLVQKKKYSFTHTMLLQDFRNFTLKKIDVFSNKELIENLKKLNKNFRVKSAHPNLLAVGESDEFYKLIKKIFNDFIDSIKM